jgi:MFS family permease
MTALETDLSRVPSRFWLVVLVSFIDKIGGTLMFPFFALYITGKFHVGMTRAGTVLGTLSLFGLVGGMIGGALTDRWGRRRLILSGLVFSALSTLALGFINEFSMFYAAAMVVGLLSDIGAPAHGAMIADLLPERQRRQGFGILRVAGNLAWIIGPTIGGFVANTSFFALFVIDAVVSCIVALLFYLLVPETQPERQSDKADESLLATFRDYRVVARDGPFVAFLLAAMLMGIVYIQMYNSLSVYLRDAHGISPQQYGFLLTTSAITVILFQFWLMRLLGGRPPFLMMAWGTAFYMVGFTMFGVVSAYWLFAVAIVVITVGEMIVMPTSQALAAHFAPIDMRGRYMAVFGLSAGIAATIGPTAAGLILDNYDPNLLWYIGGLLCAVSVLAFYALHVRLGSQQRFAQGASRPEALEPAMAAGLAATSDQ